MNMFITIHDRKEDRDINIDMTTVESFHPDLIKDFDKSEHICIVYIMRNGIRIEEEFTTYDDRQDRLEELNLYLVN